MASTRHLADQNLGVLSPKRRLDFRDNPAFLAGGPLPAGKQGGMRQLLPTPTDDASVETIYGDVAQGAASGRPYVVVNMVSSVDGAIAVDGLSGGLSGAADRAVFSYLRSLADVILVGAQTARAENYGPPKVNAARIEQRLARGQQPFPRIAVVTRSLTLDSAARLFTEVLEGEQQPIRPYVICPEDASEAAIAAIASVADVITAGEGGVDDTKALAELAQRGVKLVLCEGGPSLNARLLEAGLVDEICLTLSSVLVGGLGRRIIGSDRPIPAVRLELRSLAEADSMLLLRYAVNSASHD